jgi:hypothetical protein
MVKAQSVPESVLWGPQGILVTDAPGVQTEPSLARTTDGHFGVAWQDQIAKIRVQTLDAAGQPLWTPEGVLVSSTSTEPNRRPVLDGDTDGGLAVAWEGEVDKTSGKTGTEVFGQRLTSGGQRIWRAGGIDLPADDTTNSSSGRLYPDGAGGYLCEWTESSLYTSASYSHLLAGYEANGSRAFEPVRVDSADTASAIDPASGVMTIWSERIDSDLDLFGLRTSLTGSVSWDLTLSDALGDQSNPAAVPDGSTGAVYVWADTGEGNSNILAQHLSSEGRPLWTEGDAALTNLSASQSDPLLVSNGDGTFWAAWSDRRDPNPGIYAARLTLDGQVLPDVNGVPIALLSPVTASALTLLPDMEGGAYLVWQDFNELTRTRVLFQHLRPDYSLEYAGPQPVTESAFGQTQPVAVPDGMHGFVAAWVENRTGMQDVYAQRVVSQDFPTPTPVVSPTLGPSPTPTNTPTVSPTPTMPSADLNGDGIVDAADLLILIRLMHAERRGE